MKKYILSVISLAVVLLCFASCSTKNKKPETTAVKVTAAQTVKVVDAFGNELGTIKADAENKIDVPDEKYSDFAALLDELLPDYTFDKVQEKVFSINNEAQVLDVTAKGNKDTYSKYIALVKKAGYEKVSGDEIEYYSVYENSSYTITVQLFENTSEMMISINPIYPAVF